MKVSYHGNMLKICFVMVYYANINYLFFFQCILTIKFLYLKFIIKMSMKIWHMRMRDKCITNLSTHGYLSWLCQVKKKYYRSTYQRVDASTTSIWFVEVNETIAHKLVVTMDTHLHMNGNLMEWSSMGNNEVVVD